MDNKNKKLKSEVKVNAINNNPQKIKMILGISVFVLILIGMVVIIAVFANNESASTELTKDDPASRALINDNVVNFILKYGWYNGKNKEDGTLENPIDIITTHNTISNKGIKDNSFVKYIAKNSSTDNKEHWTIKIMTANDGKKLKWIRFDNVENTNQLNALLENEKTWSTGINPETDTTNLFFGPFHK